MSNDEMNIERTFYPDGTLQSETPYRNGQYHGAVRHWHENGQLMSESPFVDGKKHGLERVWNEEGVLIGEGQFEHGSGMTRAWHGNGKLSSVLYMRDGVPHGCLRAWDEGGELLGEQYFIRGKKVSKKKFLEACATDNSLVHEYTESVALVTDTAPESSTEGSEVSPAMYGDARDALEWLGASSSKCMHCLGELGDTQASIDLVQEFLTHGALRVFAVEIDDDDDLQTSSQLLVELPSQKAKRKRALEFCNRKNAEQGFELQTDVGQQFVHVALD